jgi:hypothetical protein
LLKITFLFLLVICLFITNTYNEPVYAQSVVPLYEENFINDEAEGWDFSEGWVLDSEELIGGGAGWAYYGMGAWGDGFHILEFDLTALSPEGVLHVGVHHSDVGRYLIGVDQVDEEALVVFLEKQYWEGGLKRLATWDSREETQATNKAAYGRNCSYYVSVEFGDGNFTVFLNSECEQLFLPDPILTAFDNQPLPPGAISFETLEETDYVMIDNVVLYGPQNQPQKDIIEFGECPEGELLYAENFDKSEILGWEWEDGWRLEDGSLRGEGHFFANYTQKAWYDLTLILRFFPIEGRNGIHINTRVSELGRYFLGINQEGIHLKKQLGWGRGEEFIDLTYQSTPIEWKTWHTLRFSVLDDVIIISVDGEEQLAFQDTEPLPAGGISLETLDESVVLVDELWVCGQADESPIIPPPDIDLPDLSIDDVRVESYDPVNRVMELSIFLVNYGNSPWGTANLVIKNRAGGGILIDKVLKAVDPRSDYIVSVEVDIPEAWLGRDTRFEVIVDPNNLIVEENEDNNVFITENINFQDAEFEDTEVVSAENEDAEFQDGDPGFHFQDLLLIGGAIIGSTVLFIAGRALILKIKSSLKSGKGEELTEMVGDEPEGHLKPRMREEPPETIEDEMESADEPAEIEEPSEMTGEVPDIPTDHDMDWGDFLRDDKRGYKKRSGRGVGVPKRDRGKREIIREYNKGPEAVRDVPEPDIGWEEAEMGVDELPAGVVDKKQAPRFLQAKAYDNSDPQIPKKLTKVFLADCEHLLKVWIGEIREGAIVAPEPIKLDKLPDAISWDLQIYFWEPHHAPEVQVGNLTLYKEPQPGEPDPTCQFTFLTRKDRGDFQGRLAVVYKNNVLQMLFLEGKVLSDLNQALDEDKIRLQWVEVKGLNNLDFLQKFDMVMFNESASGVGSGLTFFGGKAGLSRACGLEHFIKDMTKSLTELCSPDSTSLEDQSSDLVMLARQGRRLYNTIQEQLGGNDISPINLRSITRLQLVSEIRDVFPLELVYVYPTPKPNAGLCTKFQQAILEGKCEDCEGLDEDDIVDVVCPLGFLGMRCVIERHMIKPLRLTKSLLDGNKYQILVGLTAGGKKLSPFNSSLAAASIRVKQKSKQKLYEALQDLFPQGFEFAANWDDWREKVKKKPSTLLLVPHTEEERTIPCLEIGETKLANIEINKSILGESEEGSRPLVLLLGCVTGLPEEPYQGFALSFSKAGAAITVITLSQIHESRAVQLAEILLKQCYQSAKDHQTFSEAMLLARRTAMAKGYPEVLTLVADGDADWVLVER